MAFGDIFQWGPNQGINIGDVGAGLLSAASFAPKVGTAFGAAQALMRGYNTANANAVRKSLGIPDLSIGQIFGSLMDWNKYGDLAGNQTFASPEQNRDILGRPVAVTAGGMYESAFMGGGPFGIFGTSGGPGNPGGYSMRTAYLPQEKLLRDYFANMAKGPYGGGWGGYDNPNSGIAAAYGMVPGTSGKFSPAIVAEGGGGTGVGGTNSNKVDFSKPVYTGGKDGVLIGYQQPGGKVIAVGDNKLNSGSYSGGYGGSVASLGAGMTASQLSAAGLGYDPTTGGFVRV